MDIPKKKWRIALRRPDEEIDSGVEEEVLSMAKENGEKNGFNGKKIDRMLAEQDKKLDSIIRMISVKMGVREKEWIEREDELSISSQDGY